MKNRSKIRDILGKFLTLAIVFILVIIIGITLFSSNFTKKMVLYTIKISKLEVEELGKVISKGGQT